MSSGSMRSLNLSNFPVPGQTISSPNRRSPSVKSDTSSDHNLSTTEGIRTSRSGAQFQCVAGTHSRTGSGMSIRSVTSGGRSLNTNIGGGSLADSVGFTFKNTTNFVHPNKQVPRSFRSRASLNSYMDEPEDVAVERMNSVTSDGGWASGWSVSGSNSMFASNPFGGSASRASSRLEDVAPEDPFGPPVEEAPAPAPARIDDDDDVSPTRGASPVPTNEPTTKSGRSLRARASSLSIKRRAKEDGDHSPGPTTPLRGSISFSILSSRDTESEDPVTRAANIAAARRAFEEKEAAKDRRAAEQEARKEIRRRRSDTRDRPHWMRRPSEAVDSGVEIIEEEVDPADTVPWNKPSSRSISPADDDSCDPLAKRPGQDAHAAAPEDANFPDYHQPGPDHSMFSSAYLDKAQDSAVFPPPQRESALFPPMRYDEGPSQAAIQAVYEIDGVLYDEYGEPVSGDPAQFIEPDDGTQERGRRLSKTKVAMGKLSKFSAWGKTRMLRV